MNHEESLFITRGVFVRVCLINLQSDKQCEIPLFCRHCKKCRRSIVVRNLEKKSFFQPYGNSFQI